MPKLVMSPLWDLLAVYDEQECRYITIAEILYSIAKALEKIHDDLEKLNDIESELAEIYSVLEK
ncbi:hypothetical protein [Thermoanaerobacter uzonensis]|uniref:hypothetical protein n=1 Tax=Thermoanaerobacter uzonensis TaxID=447593 RepID=UPI003D7679F7